MKQFLIYLGVLSFSTMFAQSQPNSSKLISSNDDETFITFNFSQYELKTVRTPKGVEQVVVAKNTSPIMQKGAPDLPKFTESIIISDTKKMKVEVLDAKFTDYQNIFIAPSKGNFSRNILPDNVPYEYLDSYNKDAFFPSELSKLDAPFIMRDYRGQAIQVYPFRYNPVTKVLRVYSEIKLRIFASGQSDDNIYDRSQPIKKIDKSYDKIYKNQFKNYLSKNTNSIPLLEEGKMLIICHDAWMSNMAPFVEWKNSIGRPTKIVSVSTAGTTSAALRQYIKNYYTNNGLAYLLLVGDATQVPPVSAGLVGGIQIGGDSDNAYGYVTGLDHYQEFFVGRFSAETVDHVLTQSQRTIDYEKGLLLETGWLNKVVSVASQEGPGDDNEFDYQHLRNIQTDLLGFTYLNPINEIFEGTQGGFDAPGFPSPTNVATALNTGAGIVNYVGHGSDTSWGTSGFSNQDVDLLVNHNKLPFIFDVACVNGNFVGQTTFAESWMRSQDNNQPTGAIAICASTINQSWSPPMVGQDEMNDILVGTATIGERKTFAGIVINGCFKMNDETSDFAMTDTWTCFGDPSLMVRTDNPTAMVVSHASVVADNSSNFLVNCNFNGAYATISSNGVILGSAIVANNVANIPIQGLTMGQNIKLVVVGFNKVYYTSNLTVITTAGTYLTVNSLESNFIEYGQSKNINLKVSNIGLQNALNVNATAQCNGVNATLTNTSYNFGNIAVNQTSAYSVNAFTLQAANNIPDQYPITIQYQLKDATNTIRTQEKVILVNAPKLVIAGMVVNDAAGNNNGILDPGEVALLKLEVKNEGHAGIANTIANLVCENSALAINYQLLGTTIAANGNHIFTFSASAPSSIAIGTVVTINSSVTGGLSNQYSANKNFSMTIGFVASYCAGGADSTVDEFISNVTFANINNTSLRATSYTNYTNIAGANINRNASYPISITNGEHFNGDHMGCWIDWNYDGDFTDSNETYLINYQNNIGIGLISVPANARIGATRMRIRVLDNATILSCGNSSYGEVEDYTVNVSSSLATDFFNETSDYIVYPNPSNGNFIVKIDAVTYNKEDSIEIYSTNGQLIYKQNGINEENQININVSQGIYFLKTKKDGETSNKKLLIH